MELSVTNGGVMELMNTADAWKAFQVMSNELSTTRMIICPEDALRRTAAANWGDNLKTNISYFIDLDANDTNPNFILAGDDNFLLNGSLANHGLVNAAIGDTLAWDTTRHVIVTTTSWFSRKRTFWGNIGLGDGSVQAVNNLDLTNYLQHTCFATNRFFVP